MFAVCTTSPNQNGVRSQVTKMKKNGWSFRLIQLEVGEYQRLHRMKNEGHAGALIEAVGDLKDTHVIEVDELTIHETDCDKEKSNCVGAFITNLETVGLTKCDCLS